MFYFTFHIGDYRKNTGHLSLLEHGIYKALLITYYETENPLDTDLKELMRAHSVRSSDEKEAFDNVIRDFFSLTEDGYFNNGADKRIRKAYKKSSKCSAAAKARWKKAESDKMHKACETDANAMRTHTKTHANASKSDGSSMLPITHNPVPNNPITQDQASESQGSVLTTNISPVFIPLSDGTEFEITSQKIDSLINDFPAINVPIELLKVRMAIWDTPAFRPHPNAAESYILSCLTNEVDFVGGGPEEQAVEVVVHDERNPPAFDEID